MQLNMERGRRGEDIAVLYLQNSGFEILHRNWRFSRFEIDVIASKNEVLHFIEVKTRASLVFGRPEESVTTQKISNILKAGEAYQIEHPCWTRVQYNILSVSMKSDQEPDCYLIEDIYL